MDKRETFWEELKRRRVVRAVLWWAAAVFVVLQVADLTFEALGFPDWAYRALVLVSAAGFPVVAWLAWMFDLPKRARWPLAVGLVLIIASLGSAMLYLAWQPEPNRGVAVATADLLEEGAELVLAHFEASDPALGDPVTEALRIGLTASPAYRLLEPPEVRRALGRMEQDPNRRLSNELARDVALREGAEAYVAGSVGRLDESYLLIARLVAVEDERTLATFRQVTEPERLIEGIDRLAAQIRRAAGESLRSVQAREPLSRVTTASLTALQSYAAGLRAYFRGEPAEAVARYRAAIEEDPGFAMAWSAMGSPLQTVASEAEWREAVRRGYELRDRLTPLERFQVEQRYHDIISGDVGAELWAYERILEIDPDRSRMVGQFGRALGQHYGDYAAARDYMQRAIAADNDFASAANIVWVHLFLGDLDAARNASERFAEDFPSTFWRHRGPFFVAYHAGDPEAARRAAEAWQGDGSAPERWRSRARLYRSLADAQAGRPDAAIAGLRADIALQAGEQRFELAVARSTDLIWLQGVIFGETNAAREEAERLLAAGWLEQTDDKGPLQFRFVRDAARVGAVSAADRVYQRWSALEPGLDHWGREENLEAAGALLAGARGDYRDATARLEALMARTGARYPPREWPSARRCQRCWYFDIARLHEAADRSDQARAWYRKVLEETEELVETPLNRILARSRLGGDELAASD